MPPLTHFCLHFSLFFMAPLSTSCLLTWHCTPHGTFSPLCMACTAAACLLSTAYNLTHILFALLPPSTLHRDMHATPTCGTATRAGTTQLPAPPPYAAACRGTPATWLPAHHPHTCTWTGMHACPPLLPHAPQLHTLLPPPYLHPFLDLPVGTQTPAPTLPLLPHAPLPTAFYATFPHPTHWRQAPLGR